MAQLLSTQSHLPRSRRRSPSRPMAQDASLDRKKTGNNFRQFLNHVHGVSTIVRAARPATTCRAGQRDSRAPRNQGLTARVRNRRSSTSSHARSRAISPLVQARRNAPVKRRASNACRPPVVCRLQRCAARGGGFGAGRGSRDSRLSVNAARYALRCGARWNLPTWPCPGRGP